MKKPNDVAKWIIVILAICGFIFNTAVVYNEVKHNAKAIIEIKQDVREIRNYIFPKK